MASRVPFGMAVPGSFKSPLRFAPATIPVTAGKNTAKTEKKFVGVPFKGSYCGQIFEFKEYQL